MHRTPQVIERTAKRWKATQLAGFAIGAGGLALVVASVVSGSAVALVTGLVLFGLGLVVCGTGTLAAWWHHG